MNKNIIYIIYAVCMIGLWTLLFEVMMPLKVNTVSYWLSILVWMVLIWFGGDLILKR